MEEMVIDFPGGARVDAHFGPYTIMTDQPPLGGGSGSAPTPFSLAAIGIMVRNGYALPTQLLLILGFSLVTYLVAEVPIISYIVRPEGTATRIETFSTWLGAHKIQAVAIVAAVIGLVFIVKGLTAL